jgi:very-short-patch-repair endonuclease
MSAEIPVLLDDLDGFQLNVNSYYEDRGYMELVDSLVRGKIDALAMSLERLNFRSQSDELKRLTYEPGGVIPVLEVLRRSIIPHVKATLPTAVRPPVHNNLFAERGALEWNNLRFRTAQEVRVAEALEAEGFLFLPNCRARLGEKGGRRENREPDFLVCHHGKWGILEIDGSSHQPTTAAADHERDRLFKHHGILVVERFPGAECFENAAGVVSEFLRILENAS